MKEKFISTFNENIQREGADKLLKWLETTDFFIAPASTKYHLSCEGGLCAHSIHVWERLHELVQNEFTYSNGEMFGSVEPDTIAVCGLLHDLCKTNFYKVEMRNTKDDTGQWIKVPYYTVDDKLPYGHGEKSVYIINGFMKLTREEAMAIRWHMGGFDDAVKGGGYAMSGAWGKYPLGVLLHIADLQATFLDETIGDNV